MAELITADTILDFLKDAVESKRVLNPNMWLEAAFKLTVLTADEHTKLEDLRQEVARFKLEIMKTQEKRNVAAAELETEASDLYRQMKLQEHKVDRIEELVRIAKANAHF